MVVITRNVDLSVEAMIGLVAFVVAAVLADQLMPTPAAMAFGVALGLVLGMINGIVVAVFRVPSIVATLGTLSIYRGIDFLLAGGKQVTLTELPAGLHGRRALDPGRDPVFVLIARGHRRGVRRCLAPDEIRAVGLRGRQQPRGGQRSSASGRAS